MTHAPPTPRRAGAPSATPVYHPWSSTDARLNAVERPAASPRDDRWAYRLVVLLVALVVLAPLLLTTYAPLIDFPNHLARTYILFHYGDDPRFAAEYVRHLAPLPNLAIDVVVPTLLWVVPPLVAGKLFLSGIVVLWMVACDRLARAIQGHRAWVALVGMLLAYHSAFQWGFVNYAAGLALGLLTFALWLERRGRWTTGGLVLVTVLSCAVFLSHLAAYAVLGCSVVVATLGREVGVTPRRLARAGMDVAPVLPPMLLLGAFLGGGASVGRIAWNSARGKLIALLGLVRAYDLRNDALFVGAFAVVAAIAIWSAWRPGAVRVHRVELGVAIALLVLFAVSPMELMSASAADSRLVPPAVIVALFAIELVPPRRVARVVVAGALGIGVVRMALIAREWRALDRRMGEVVALVDGAPRGSRVLSLLTPRDGADVGKIDRVYEHAAFYAIIDRGDYVPRLFADGAQPLVARRFRANTVSARALFARHASEFDYVLTMNPPVDEGLALRRCCTRVGVAGGAELWRVGAVTEPAARTVTPSTRPSARAPRSPSR